MKRCSALREAFFEAPADGDMVLFLARFPPFLGGPFTMWISWVPRRSRASSKSWRGTRRTIPAGCMLDLMVRENKRFFGPKPWSSTAKDSERRPNGHYGQ
jgi:hypothetical protein